MMKTCPNLHEFNLCMQSMTSRHYTHIALKGINSDIGRKGSTTILGENRTNQKNVGRHKSIAERNLINHPTNYVL